MALDIQPIHPFPARMAPDILWERLQGYDRGTLILDPMMGSGTTLAAAKSLGLNSIGFDTDPLAVLMGQGWAVDADADVISRKAVEVIARAKARARNIAQGSAYPRNANDETKAFVRYWFDPRARIQLTALSQTISCLRDSTLRTVFWCAFSRLIITKSVGVSLAMDVSHSRPHRVYDIAPVSPFERFSYQVGRVIKALASIRPRCGHPTIKARRGDARNIPLKHNTVDLVLTSPPYLNAIDYLRGHRLSLVWMGYQIDDLRIVRSGNVGTEAAGSIADRQDWSKLLPLVTQGSLEPRFSRIVSRYIHDMNRILGELHRVLKRGGQAIFVVANSVNRSSDVRNSEILIQLAELHGYSVEGLDTRELPENRRYLPPPGRRPKSCRLGGRMRQEFILTLQKAS